MQSNMQKIVAFAGLCSVVAGLTACGDEITEVSNDGIRSVAAYKDLDKCGDKNEGDLVFVKGDAAVYLCADDEWKELNAGSEGVEGKDGKNGTSCTVKALKDSSGFDVLCDGKKVGQLLNGEKGDQGENGNDGKSCTVKENKKKNGYDLVCGDETVTITNGDDGESIVGPQGESCLGKTLDNGDIQITCGKSFTGVLHNGTDGNDGKSAYEIAKDNGFKGTEEEWLESLNGAPGASCTVKKNNKNGFDLNCGGKVVTVSNGAAGESCSGKSNADGSVTISCGGNEVATITNGSNGTSCFIANDMDGVVTLQCGEGANATTTKLYKAMCGSEPYDPETQLCDDQKNVMGKCGDKPYNVKTQFCNVVDVYERCGEKLLKYDPNKETCDNDKVRGICGTIIFDFSEYLCMSGTLFPRCGEKDTYDPEWQTCNSETGEVTDKPTGECGDKLYTTEDKFCDNREGENVIYKFVTIKGSVNGEKYSRTWMAENLKYKTTEGSVCYPGDDDCLQYGRFYTWDAANSAVGEKDICPEGWMLPTDQHYLDLLEAVGDYDKLKTKTGWKNRKDEVVTYSDVSGFDAKPIGWLEKNGDSFSKQNQSDADFWTSDFETDVLAKEFYVGIYMATWSSLEKTSYLPVRCIKMLSNN